MTIGIDVFTTAVNTCNGAIKSLSSQFLGYGQSIFWPLFTISLVLMGLKYMMSKDITESLPEWIRNVVGIMFFYTLMVNVSWLGSILNSVNVIGKTLAGGIDPSALIDTGLSLGNAMIKPLADGSILDLGFGSLVILACYIVVNVTIFTIALSVSVTLIITQFLITISPIFLAFGAFEVTKQFAKNGIDRIAGNSGKLLGFYLVIFLSNNVLTGLAAQIPQDANPTAFDPYLLLAAITTLLFLLAKNLPQEVGSIFAGVTDTKGVEVAALAASVAKLTNAMQQAAKVAKVVANPAAAVAGATMANAMANYRQIASSNPNSSTASKAGAALKQAAGTTAGATANNISDRFRNIADRVSGGSGNNVKSVAERVYQNTQSVKSQTQAKSK